MASRDDIRRWRTLWEDEMAGAALYRGLADADPRRRDIFLQLADAEERHAAHWEKLLAEAGVNGLRRPRPPARVRVLSWLAKRFGSSAVLPIVVRLEAADASKYDDDGDAPSSMAASERVHGRVVASMEEQSIGGQIVRSEGRHRSGAGGALRAAVFGVNDGLVSNLSLVMGVAGGTGNSRFVLLAGVAGLLAGSFSMAAGEWVSVRSQSELYEREIEVEREELARFPDEEREELALIFRAKGLDIEEANALASRIMSQPESALDTLAREELGLDPNELASPWVAAASSFVAFAFGAVIPVIPYIVGSGTAAFAAALLVSIATLFVVGWAISVLTGRSPVRSGLRMTVIGALAAGLTYGVGRLLNVGIS